MKSDVQLNLRAKESQRALIDAAAEILDMLDAPVADDPAIEKLLARKPQWDV